MLAGSEKCSDQERRGDKCGRHLDAFHPLEIRACNLSLPRMLFALRNRSQIRHEPLDFVMLSLLRYAISPSRCDAYPLWKTRLCRAWSSTFRRPPIVTIMGHVD